MTAAACAAARHGTGRTPEDLQDPLRQIGSSRVGPIAFLPLFLDRVWGGQTLAARFGKPLPGGVPIGESWEISDRDDAMSVATRGVPAGTSLHELWTTRREEVFGTRATRCGERFPLLVKLLDARDTLSVQVHPPPAVADALGGEPKSEMWFVAAAEPGAHLFAGLRAGVTREGFEAALHAGEDVSTMLHRFDVRPGDAIYLPSGRVHAIGAGCLVVEVQQNSDTTYRVFDFNRPGLDGRPRELHVAEAMASIAWDDVEPSLAEPDGEVVARTPYFTVSHWQLAEPRRATVPGECAVVCVLSGTVSCGDATFTDGDFFLVPAGAEDPQLWPARAAELLLIELPG
jgi:mannose-6-phosphate isomerase